MHRYRKSGKDVPVKPFQGLLKKQWLFAGAAFGADLAMLVLGMVLSRLELPVNYTVTGNVVSRSEPLAFFGVIAAVVIGIICVLTALIIAGSFRQTGKPAHWLPGTVGAVCLLLVSLVMVGGSWFMVYGFPQELVNSFSFSDESCQLIIEEKRTAADNTVSFFLTKYGDEENKTAIRLASTKLKQLSENAERYTINWVSETDLVISFEDDEAYRTIQLQPDKALINAG